MDREQRLERIKQESEEFQLELALRDEQQAKNKADQENAVRQADSERLAEQSALIKSYETRETILDRIRAMREEKPPEIKPMGRTPEQMEQLRLEQEAGRAAVAQAQEMEEKYRALRVKQLADDAVRQATMSPVHHPNPNQKEQYPASKATLGKTK